MIYDATPCDLGEGPLWHPGRGQLFWFDILRHRLLTREGGATRVWSFDASSRPRAGSMTTAC
jgi:sugar lactone lactonase YvrE